MKKSILALAMMAMLSMTASAVSVAWTSNALSFNGTVLKNNSSVSAYLIYLGEETLGSYSLDSFAASDIGTVAASASSTVKSGKAQGTLQFLLPAYDNGDAFAMLVQYTNAEDGKTYYNLSSVINTLSGIVDDRSSPTFNEFAMNNDVVGAQDNLSAGAGWTTLSAGGGGGGDDPTPGVPEPATGALALAGLALLFRRKRA